MELGQLRRARDFIDREFARPLDVPAMAARALMSPSHFARRYHDVYGETPYQHLLTRRIERARTLLVQTELPVTEICWAVGFSSLGSFSTRFHELTGHTPPTTATASHAGPDPPTAPSAGTGCPAHQAADRAAFEKRRRPGDS